MTKYKNVGSGGVAASTNAAAEVAIPTQATHVMVQANTQPISITLDGHTPTAVDGFVLTTSMAPQIFPLGYQSKLNHIRATGTNGVIAYQFLKEIW